MLVAGETRQLVNSKQYNADTDTFYTKEAQEIRADSAQRAEPIAVTRALELGSQQTVHIYTDSAYVYEICHWELSKKM